MKTVFLSSRPFPELQALYADYWRARTRSSLCSSLVRSKQRYTRFGRIWSQCYFAFGPDVVEIFSYKLDLDLIFWAHYDFKNGWESLAKHHLITLLSAPNYCGEYGNARNWYPLMILCCSPSKCFDQLRKRITVWVWYKVVNQPHLLVVQKHKVKSNRTAFVVHLDFRSSQEPKLDLGRTSAVFALQLTCASAPYVHQGKQLRAASGFNLHHFICLLPWIECCDSESFSTYIAHPSITSSSFLSYVFKTLTYPCIP